MSTLGSASHSTRDQSTQDNAQGPVTYCGVIEVYNTLDIGNHGSFCPLLVSISVDCDTAGAEDCIDIFPK